MTVVENGEGGEVWGGFTARNKKESVCEGSDALDGNQRESAL